MDNPPTSSYVTRVFLSPDVSSKIVSAVERSIFTTPFGEILLILKSIEFPRIITDISSPCIRGSPLSLFFTKSVNSLSTVTISFTGIKTTDFAALVITFFILTMSFNDPAIFFLVCPSIFTMSGNLSSSSDGQTIAQVDLLPLISMTSPGDALR